MKDDDVNDIFDDFEHKVTGKEPEEHHKSESEEDLLKSKYQQAEQVLKEKYNKEKEALIEKKGGVPDRNNAPKGFGGYEKIAYMSIILILVVYTIVDLTVVHNADKVVEPDVITAAAVDLEETEEETVEETVEEVEEEIVKELSGRIDFKIDKIFTDVSENDDDLGYISKIVFTIENGKDKVLTPVAEVFAYDDELDAYWETRSRGKYFGIPIEPGETQTGSIDITPQSFRNLNIDKSIRLTLNDTVDGLVAALNDRITIS